MFFPIGDDQVNGGFKPYVSYSLIAINVLIFIYEVSLPSGQLAGFITDHGTIPQEIVHGQDLYTLFTSMFMHAGWMHLIGNMLFLWVFADNIEAIIGNYNFLGFYLVGGLVASFAHIISGPASIIPSLGASGAIAAVLGMYLIMFPVSKIKVLAFIWIFKVPAFLFLGIWIIQQFISGVGSLSSASGTSGVAWWAHIGGFVFGLVIGIAVKKYFMNPTNYIDNDYV